MKPWLAMAFALAACDAIERPILFSLPEDAYWRDTRGYPGLGQGRILITNNLSDTVSILDLAGVGAATLPELTRVPVGRNPVEREGPHHLTAAGEFYYVGISNFVPFGGSGPHGSHGLGTAAGYVLKIRGADNLQVGEARVERNPGDVRLTPDGKLLLVSHFDVLRLQDEDPRSKLAFVDPETMSDPETISLCPAAHGIGVSADSREAYVSCYDDHMAVVDLTTRTLSKLVPVIDEPGPPGAPVCEPYAMTVGAGAVWVSCFGDGRVLRYAGGAMDREVAIDIGGRAVFGDLSADGRTLYVTHQEPDGVAVIDVATRTQTGNISMGREACENAHAVRLTDDQRFLLVVCEGDHAAPGTLVVVDAATRAVVSATRVGVFPDDVQVLRP